MQLRHDLNIKGDIGAKAGYLRDWTEDTTETVADISICMTPAKKCMVRARLQL